MNFLTFLIFLSIDRGRLNRNLYLCRTVNALRVVSAFNFLFSKPWNKASASNVVPIKREEGGEGERERERERERGGERVRGRGQRRDG